MGRVQRDGFSGKLLVVLARDITRTHTGVCAYVGSRSAVAQIFKNFARAFNFAHPPTREKIVFRLGARVAKRWHYPHSRTI